MSIEGPDDPNNEMMNSNEENTSLTDTPATAAQDYILEEEGTVVDDEIDEEAIVQGAAESSVQIAPTDNLNPSLQRNDDPMLSIELGDRIIIFCV
jgi:hypothetical protein